MSETKIINVAFGKSRDATTSARYRYDYGQVIEVVGINLPETFEARFSNSPHGESIRVIGTQNKVDVPDGLFLTGEPIYCYITVHDEDTDGRTMYSIKIPVKDSTERTDADPMPVEQDVITQAIASLNNAIDRTTENVEFTNTNVELAQESAANAQSYAESANSYAENAEASAVRASDSETHVGQMVTEVEQIAQRAETASSNAESSASVATQKANEASTSATNAEKSALNAQDSALTAQGYMDSASNFANQAEISATKAKSSADDAELSKNHAEKMAMDTEKSKQHVEQISDEFDTRVEQAIDNVSTMGQELAEKAEAWAVGERNGKPIKQDDPAYNNNAKYWAVQAHTDSESASSDAQSASASATSASESAYEASKSADRAEQVAQKAGYLDVEIVNGRLIYTRTDAVDVDFYLEGGRLIMEGI